MNARHGSGTHMPHQDTDSNAADLGEQPARLRIFDQDSELVSEIVRDAKGVMRDITIQGVLRDAIHVGLPIVRKKLRAMCDAAKTNTTNT